MAGTTSTPEENALQEEVISVSNLASNIQALTSLRSHVVSMMNRATAAFVFSIIGAAYQMISLYVAVLIDRNMSPFFYFTVGYYTLFLTGFIVIWSASHILEDWKGRITWPSIILVLGIANLASVVMSDYAQTSSIQGSATYGDYCYSLWTVTNRHWRDSRFLRRAAILKRAWPRSFGSRLIQGQDFDVKRRRKATGGPM
jgi:hypothetical protein